MENPPETGENSSPSSSLSSDALTIFSSAIAASAPAVLLSNFLHLDASRKILTIGEEKQGRVKFQLEKTQENEDSSAIPIDRIIVIAAGKAASPMASAVERLLGDFVTEGILITKDFHTLPEKFPLKKIRAFEAGHPMSDQRGVEASERLRRLVEAHQKDPRCLILALISGGASALLCRPVEGISLSDYQKTQDLLLASGCSIEEFNIIRSRLDSLKAGGLARLAGSANLVGLILSDVIGDSIKTIGSGPTVVRENQMNREIIEEILQRFKLTENIPTKVLERLRTFEDSNSSRSEFSSPRNFLIGSNLTALAAARRAAESLGYGTLVLTNRLAGEGREIGKFYAALAQSIRQDNLPITPPAAILIGGEATITLNTDGIVKSHGLGGRNQEIALSAAIELENSSGRPVVILSGGTDGSDGPTDAAGARIDDKTAETARNHGLEPRKFLACHDSYHFFQRLDEAAKNSQESSNLLRTGATGTNVMDIAIILVK